MPSHRSSTRVSAPVAWQEQNRLYELQARLLALPDSTSLPCHIKAAVDTVVGCLQLGPQTATSTGGKATPTSSCHATTIAGASVASAALTHLQAALSLVPSNLTPVAHSMAHALLLFSTTPGRSVAEVLGAVADDLALPASWQVSVAAYRQLVLVMGWEPLLLESVVLLDMVAAAQQSCGLDNPPASSNGHSHAVPATPTTAGTARTMSAAVQLLQSVVTGCPALAASLFQLLWSGLATGSSFIPSQSGHMSPMRPAKVWQASLALLEAMTGQQHDKSASGSQQAAAGTDVDSDLCVSLARCCNASLSVLRAGAPSTSHTQAVARAAGHAAALLEAQLSQLQGVAHSTPPNDMQWQLLCQDLQQLLTALQQQPAQPPTVYPTAEVMRLKCRLALLLPTLQTRVATDLSEEVTPPVHTAPAMLLFPWQLTARTPGTDSASPQALTQQDCFAFASTEKNRTWQTAVKAAVPRQSRHGLSAAHMQALAVYARTGTLGPLPSAISEPAAGVHGTWAQVAGSWKGSATELWELRVTGWLLAGLTPGMPCLWQGLQHSQVIRAEDTACYGPIRAALACLELAACMDSACGQGDSVLAQSDAAGAQGLLSIATAAMQQVSQPAQQLALQTAVLDNPVIHRLLLYLGKDEAAQRSSAVALVSLSNQSVGDSATRAANNTALGAAGLEKLLASTAADLLPYAVLVPHQLLQRAVADCLQHRGQLGFWLQLLSGPLRPTAKAARPISVLSGNLSGSSSVASACVVPGPNTVPAVLIAIRDYVMQQCVGSAGAGLPDGQLRALAGLIVGCMSQQSALVSGQTLLSQLAVPLLTWCAATPDTLCQARTLLMMSAFVVSGPPVSTGTIAAPSADAVPYPLLWSLLQQTQQTQSGDEPMQVVVDLLQALCAVLHRLQQADILYAAAIDNCTELLEGCVASVAAAVAHPDCPPRLAVGLLTQVTGAEPVSTSGGLLATLLPLIQVCVTTASRAPVEDQATEDQVAEVSSLVLRVLAPAPAAGARSRSAATGAQLLVTALLWFVAGHASHSVQLLGSCREWAGEELEEVADAGGGDTAAQDGVGVAQWQAVVEFLGGCQELLGDEQHTGHSTPAAAVGMARSCARSLQRQLCRQPAAELATALVQQLQLILPVLSTPQAARVLAAAVPAVLVASSSETAEVSSWAIRQLAVYQLPPGAAPASGTDFHGAVRQMLHGSTGPAFSAASGSSTATHQPVPTALPLSQVVYRAYLVHAVCSVVKHLAQEGNHQAQAVRCQQHLVASISLLLGSDRQPGAAAAPAAGSAGQLWCLALLVLPDLVTLWHELQLATLGTEMLQVAVLRVLSVLLQPRLELAPAATTDQQAGTAAGSAPAAPGAQVFCPDLGLSYQSVAERLGRLLSVAAEQEVESLGSSALYSVQLAAVHLAEEHLNHYDGSGTSEGVPSDLTERVLTALMPEH